VLLRVDLDADVSQFEWIEDGVVNAGTVRRVTEEEEDALARAAWEARYAALPPELRAKVDELRASMRADAEN
jgi:hypothetical protein